VRFINGGRGSRRRYGGSFKRKADALRRKAWIDGEHAAMRVPDLSLHAAEPERQETLSDAADRWMATRIDVAETTMTRHRVELTRINRHLGTRPDEVADFVAALAGEGYKLSVIRKTLQTLAMIFDRARVDPNPARDKLTVKLPREDAEEINPPE
jgi:hypothetical protein